VSTPEVQNSFTVMELPSIPSDFEQIPNWLYGLFKEKSLFLDECPLSASILALLTQVFAAGSIELCHMHGI
jgi:hypothetical protein